MGSQEQQKAETKTKTGSWVVICQALVIRRPSSASCLICTPPKRKQFKWSEGKKVKEQKQHTTPQNETPLRPVQLEIVRNKGPPKREKQGQSRNTHTHPLAERGIMLRRLPDNQKSRFWLCRVACSSYSAVLLYSLCFVPTLPNEAFLRPEPYRARAICHPARKTSQRPSRNPFGLVLCNLLLGYMCPSPWFHYLQMGGGRRSIMPFVYLS